MNPPDYPDPAPSLAVQERIAAMDAEIASSHDHARRWELFSRIQFLLWGPAWRDRFAAAIRDPSHPDHGYYRRFI